jgi:hypothetical protein
MVFGLERRGTLPTFDSALYWRSIYSHAQRDYRCGAEYISEVRLENTDLILLSSRVFAVDNPNAKDTVVRVLRVGNGSLINHRLWQSVTHPCLHLTPMTLHPILKLDDFVL